MDRATAELRLGEILGRYTLTGVLGVGGMATVYKAVHRNGHKVALKLLHPQFATRVDVRARFVQEAYTANKVEHPGVVRVIDDDVAADGSAFMVMDLLEGETLDAWQAREGPMLPAEQVFEVVHEVLDVLVHAHWYGIVHRDLKPENVFRTSEGRIKVLDFGIARLTHESAPSAKTRTGSLLGTPAFMPPEQAQGRLEQIDGRTDLWAVGATAFALLSGRYVHEAETLALLNIAAGTQEARAVTPLVPGLAPELADLVDTALRFEKTQRWSSARAMQDALEIAFAQTFGRSLATPQQAALRASLREPESERERAESAEAPPTLLPLPSASPETRVTASTTTNEGVSAPQRASWPGRAGRAGAGLAAAALMVVGLGFGARLARPARVAPHDVPETPRASVAEVASETTTASPARPVVSEPDAAAPTLRASEATLRTAPLAAVPPAPASATRARPTGSAAPSLAPSAALGAPAPSAPAGGASAPPEVKPSCDPWYILEDGKKRRKPWC